MGSVEFERFQTELTEKMARLFQEGGNSPLLGRIYALLQSSPGPVSLQQMAERIGVTKAAVSIQIRLLVTYGFCEKLPRGNDRKDYYSIPKDHLQLMMDKVTHRLRTECESIEDTLRKLPDPGALEPDEQAMAEVLETRYSELLAFYRIMFRRLEGIEEETARLIADLRGRRGI